MNQSKTTNRLKSKKTTAPTFSAQQEKLVKDHIWFPADEFEETLLKHCLLIDKFLVGWISEDPVRGEFAYAYALQNSDGKMVRSFFILHGYRLYSLGGHSSGMALVNDTLWALRAKFNKEKYLATVKNSLRKPELKKVA